MILLCVLGKRGPSMEGVWEWGVRQRHSAQQQLSTESSPGAAQLHLSLGFEAHL